MDSNPLLPRLPRGIRSAPAEGEFIGLITGNKRRFKFVMKCAVREVSASDAEGKEKKRIKE